MIRFKIIGSGYLDLPADFDFSFQYNNSVFAFENMQLSRSSEFSIPATPVNNALLGFANNPGMNGEVVRKKLNAELHYSGGKITGLLSIGKFDGSQFSAIFVYGELTALKFIQDKGNISNYTSFSQALTVNTGNIVSAYKSDGTLNDYSFKFYKYKNGVADGDKLVSFLNMMPTVRLSKLMTEAATAAGLTVDTTALGTGKDAIGIILATNNATPTLESVSVSGIPNDTLSFTGGSEFFTLETKTFKYKPFGSPFYFNKLVKVLQAKRDCKIKFESGYTSIGCVSGDGRKFLSTGNAEGFFRSILIDTEIEIKSGEYFTFVHLQDYRFDIPEEPFDTSVSVDLKVYTGDSGTVEQGESFSLFYNLPEITLIDIFKIYASLFRCGITYDVATSTIAFFNFAFDKSDPIELDDIVIQLKSVERTFIDYAQKNVVNCKSEDYVQNKFELRYTIDNENLQAEKTLYTIPFSEGILSPNADVTVNDFELVEPFKKTAKTGTLCVASKTVGHEYLKHISQLYQNFTITDSLTNIIRNSTTVEMSVKMDVKTFLSIGSTDVFKYRGRFYCCLNATHTNGVADLVLVKI